MSGAGEEEDKKPVITRSDFKGVASTGLPARVASTGLPARVASTGLPAQVASTGLPARVASTGLPARVASTGLPAQVASTGLPAQVASTGLPARTAKPPESDRIVEGVTPADQAAAHINLKVKGQNGTEVFFRIKSNTQLRKLMNAYCDKQSVDFNSIAFLFDGRRLGGEQTPNELAMEDGDEIDAMLHQTGGGRHSGA